MKKEDVIEIDTYFKDTIFYLRNLRKVLRKTIESDTTEQLEYKTLILATTVLSECAERKALRLAEAARLAEKLDKQN